MISKTPLNPNFAKENDKWFRAEVSVYRNLIKKDRQAILRELETSESVINSPMLYAVAQELRSLWGTPKQKQTNGATTTRRRRRRVTKGEGN